MYNLTLPKLIIDVFNETGNRNNIQHFLAQEKNIEFEEFEDQQNFIVVNYQEKNIV